MLRVGFIKNISRGFTLIEVLVVIAIISILAGFIAVNSAESNQKARDEKRQADLRALQSAIEMYKNKDPNKQYPLACDSRIGVWAGQQGTAHACAGGNTQYIVGLAPEFIPVLPVDPKLNGSDSGYVYMVNSERTVYKLMALNTVESDTLTYSHPFKRCDLNSAGGTDILVNGWCTNPSWNHNDTPSWCKTGDFGFDHSYAVWGGFAKLFNWQSLDPSVTTVLQRATAVRDTSTIICR